MLSQEDIKRITTADIQERLAFQERRLVRILGNSAVVPANGNVELAIQVSNEGDFLCHEIRGRIIPSDFQTYYGISARMFDNSKTELIQNCSLDSILSPGYGMRTYRQIKEDVYLNSSVRHSQFYSVPDVGNNIDTNVPSCWFYATDQANGVHRTDSSIWVSFDRAFELLGMYFSRYKFTPSVGSTKSAEAST